MIYCLYLHKFYTKNQELSQITKKFNGNTNYEYSLKYSDLEHIVL